MCSFASDLKQLHDFIQGQSKILSMEALGKLLDSQAQQLSLLWGRDGSQINMATLGELSTLVAAGPWSNSQKEMLGNVLGTVAARLTKSENPSGKTFRGRRPSQQLKAFSGYLTDGDLASLSSDAHNAIKVKTLVNRCYKMGLHLPSEPTIQHIVSTGITLGITGSSSEQKLLLLKEFKAQLRSMVQHQPAPPVFLVEFPKNPNELPEDLFKMSYGEEKPAVTQGELQVSAGVGCFDVPCRKTNKLVRKTSGLDVGVSPEATNTMNMFGAMMMNFFQQQAGSSGLDPFANLQVFHNKRRQKKLEDEKVDAAPKSVVLPALEDKKKSEAQDDGGSDANGKIEVETMTQANDEVKDEKNMFDLGMATAFPLHRHPNTLTRL